MNANEGVKPQVDPKSLTVAKILEEFGKPLATCHSSRMNKVLLFSVAAVVIGMELLDLQRDQNLEKRFAVQKLCVFLGVGVFAALKGMQIPRKTLSLCPGGIIWHSGKSVRAIEWNDISSFKVEQRKRLYWKASSSESSDRTLKSILEIHMAARNAMMPIDGEFYANFPKFLKALFEEARRREIPWMEVDSVDSRNS